MVISLQHTQKGKQKPVKPSAVVMSHSTAITCGGGGGIWGKGYQQQQ